MAFPAFRALLPAGHSVVRKGGWGVRGRRCGTSCGGSLSNESLKTGRVAMLQQVNCKGNQVKPWFRVGSSCKRLKEFRV